MNGPTLYFMLEIFEIQQKSNHCNFYCLSLCLFRMLLVFYYSNNGKIYSNIPLQSEWLWGFIKSAKLSNRKLRSSIIELNWIPEFRKSRITEAALTHRRRRRKWCKHSWLLLQNAFICQTLLQRCWPKQVPLLPSIFRCVYRRSIYSYR